MLVSRPSKRAPLGARARRAGTQGPCDVPLQGVLRFASLALDPGSRSTRARALAALARDTLALVSRPSKRARLGARARRAGPRGRTTCRSKRYCASRVLRWGPGSRSTRASALAALARDTLSPTFP